MRFAWLLRRYERPTDRPLLDLVDERPIRSAVYPIGDIRASRYSDGSTDDFSRDLDLIADALTPDDEGDEAA